MYYRDSNGVLRSSALLGGEVREPRPAHVVVHKEVCPLPDLESALRMVGNRPHTSCRHKFPDGKTAWRRKSFQIQGAPAESTKCALCRITIMLFFEGDE